VHSIEQPFPGAHLLQPRVVTDERGEFVKTFHAPSFAAVGIEFSPVEEFFSTSRRNVIRGMHFQLPPFDHSKLVYCIRGAILDVVIDIRKTSSSFGRVYSTRLTAINRRMLFLPRGLAHGFVAEADDSVMVYQTDMIHAPAADAGVRWDSFGFNWSCADPVISSRDRGLPALAEFSSPW
jgi:dTDP-4-dehydrorhamnose 3,5-epimerase